MHHTKISSAVALGLLSFCGLGHALDVTKCQYDLACTGANTAETILTPANVDTANFGKLFTKSVDGNVYAQPLYLQNFPIAGGVHNVLIVCTENNSVYAFNADSAAADTFWHRKLPTPQTISCVNLQPTVGITATPVIDRAFGAVFVQAATEESSAYYQKLYALNLTNGTDMIPPVTIVDSVAGTGAGAVNGKVGYNALYHFCRPGLLLANKRIYIGSGSHCDANTYHGWLFAFAESTLALTSTFNTTPNGSEGAIWQMGGGLTSDGANVFCVVGNGTAGSAGEYGLSVVKLDSLLNPLGYFTAYNYSTLNTNDYDLASSCLLIPGTTLCAACGKGGSLYLMNQNSLGGLNTSADSIVQRIDNATPTEPGGGDAVGVFWNNILYMWAGSDVLKAWTFNGTTFNTTPQSSGSPKQTNSAGAITVSANGDSSGIVWGTNVNNHLYAYNAANVSTLLWSSGQAAGKRDTLGSPVLKFARPMVVNGKVYVPTTNSVVVYGLLHPQGTATLGRSEQTGGGPLVTSLKLERRSLSLAFSRAGNYDITVTDMSGRTVAKVQGTATGGLERISLPGAGLQPGAYTAIIRFAQQQITMQAIMAQ